MTSTPFKVVDCCNGSFGIAEELSGPTRVPGVDLVMRFANVSKDWARRFSDDLNRRQQPPPKPD
jgi:predicted RNA methylase